NDNAEGTITVYGGTFEIQGGSDGMQACALLEINGGTMNIYGAEGLEATYIRINDGTISIQASDDGINASTGTSAYETAVEINGGYLTIAVGQGDTDAIDANGSIYVNGGTIDITAQMSSFDYDRTAEFNGGTIIINGTEVTEIPQSMMGGGGMFGGRGRMNGGMPDDTEDGMSSGMFGGHGRMKGTPA
ncbi:MAG: carbohydrate-binding domain-containing protein, partial [Oscillospiraceae bacterium]|nr:carbohydrate-binding domain-containing protein [Oscillospiraceae bacterium]